MKCHYFKQNTELYRVQLYSRQWMGATASIYLTTFCSNLIIFLAFLPHYLHYGPTAISHVLQQHWTNSGFPKPLPCSSFPSGSSWISAFLFFLEKENLISSQYPKYLLIYDCQPSPHCTFSPAEGGTWPCQNITHLRFVRETGKEHRWQRW